MIDNEQVEEILLILDDKLTKTVSVLKEDYAAVRAGRANPHVLDKVMVDYYGALTRAGRQMSRNFPLGRIPFKGNRKGYPAVEYRHHAH